MMNRVSNHRSFEHMYRLVICVSLTGYGQEQGGVMTRIYNNHPKKRMTIAYLETVPWFLRVYYHTLVVESFGSEETTGNIAGNGSVIKPGVFVSENYCKTRSPNS